MIASWQMQQLVLSFVSSGDQIGLLISCLTSWMVQQASQGCHMTQAPTQCTTSTNKLLAQATTKVHTIESFLRVAVGDAGALSMLLSFSLPSTLTHTSLAMLESSSFSYPNKHHQCINRHSKPHAPAKYQKASTKNVASD